MLLASCYPGAEKMACWFGWHSLASIFEAQQGGDSAHLIQLKSVEGPLKFENQSFIRTEQTPNGSNSGITSGVAESALLN